MDIQLTLFSDVHEHVYRVTQGPYETQGEITSPDSGSRWCRTCHEWVTVHADGRTGTYTERTAFRRSLILDIKAGKMSRDNAVKAYRKEFQTSFMSAVWEIDWAIGYFNENGWV